MDLLKILQDLVATINVLQAQLADVPAALEAAKKLSYDEGFAAGVASVPPPVSDKIFSQEELDAKLAEAIEPLEKKIVELQVVVDGIDALVKLELAKQKEDLITKIRDLELKEMADIDDLFKGE